MAVIGNDSTIDDTMPRVGLLRDNGLTKTVVIG